MLLIFKVDGVANTPLAPFAPTKNTINKMLYSTYRDFVWYYVPGACVLSQALCYVRSKNGINSKILHGIVLNID